MNIGFIGLGRMGSNMARRLAEAGHRVAAYDVRPEAAAQLAETIANIHPVKSIADAARDAEVVGTSLPGPKEVEPVVLGAGGLLESMRPGATYIDLSSNSVSLVRRLSAALAERGIAMLDAPVSGGVTGAANGTLSIMVGGDKDLFERMKPVLRCLGPEEKLFYCGPPGAGDVVKLCNNLLAVVTTVANAEVLTLGVRAGVDLVTLLRVIGVSSGTNRGITGGLQRGTLRRVFSPPFFTLALSAKDTLLALDLAHEVGVDVGVFEVVGREMEIAVAHGLGDLSFEAAVMPQEERSGVVLQLSEEELATFAPPAPR